MSTKPKNREKAKRQTEVANKVKEMKIRQEQWMKQRDVIQNQKTNLPGGRAMKTVPITPKEEHKSTHSKSDQKWPKRTNLDLSASERKKKFQDWIQAREITSKTEPTNTEHNSDYKRNISDIEDNHKTEVNILRVPSVRSSQYASPEPSTDSDGDKEIGTSKSVNELFSPQNFDDLADKIIARVKNDLKITPKPQLDNVRHQMKSSHTQKERGVQVLSVSEMSSHYCPKCQALMIPPTVSPVLLIPCGHTVCDVCAKRYGLCPSCDCHVSSKTGNIMLQQIILDFHSQRDSSSQTNSAPKKTSYSPGLYQEVTYTKNSSLDYEEKYSNLMTRQEVLRQEATAITGCLEQLTKQQTKHRDQIRNIVNQEHKIEEQIQALEERLQLLVEHRRGYEQTCEELEHQRASESGRLSLVQKTLLTLHEETEKVRLLAGYDD
ncbi:hypothetical protein ScPMuIL_015424 [Solemya velum]